MANVKLHTNLAMKKANKNRQDYLGDYRRQMNRAIKDAYRLKHDFEDRMADVDADYECMAQAYLKGDTVNEMELEYLVQNDASKVTPQKLLDMDFI